MKRKLIIASLLLAGCQAEPEVPKGSREASEADANRLETIAVKACECTRQTKSKEFWQPIAHQDKNYTEAPPPPCWQEFAEALHPFGFENAPDAACGPGSDFLQIIVGPDRGAEAAMEPTKSPRRAYYVQLHGGFGTCTGAEFEKAKAEYEAESKRPTCG